MRKHVEWDFGDLDGYIREGEPGQAARADNWQVAIGLQAVDGLTPSSYLFQTAKEHIEGRIDIGEAQRRIRSYYEERGGREVAEGEEEADIVSSHIA
ncbi:MAG: antitoxin VbhA family protein [Coriobacteriales bacterium]|nr:antitoxin VbhA family protein [Coriobacteriales bacterium]